LFALSLPLVSPTGKEKKMFFFQLAGVGRFCALFSWYFVVGNKIASLFGVNEKIIVIPWL